MDSAVWLNSTVSTIPRCLHDPLFMLRVFMPRFRGNYIFEKKKLEREDAWMDERMDNFLLGKSIERIIFKDSNVRVWDME